MPVYVRKTTDFTPRSMENIPDLDENDFVFVDPDALKDLIPQPLRLVTKIVDKVFDSAWEIISKIESKKTANLNKIRAPIYDCGVKLQDNEKATALTDSVDGRYIFVALPNGISVMDALTQETVATWDEEKVDIVHIKCHLIGVQTYLLVTVDEMGVAKLFIFSCDKIFLLKILNEQEPDSTKIICTKCEASSEGDYFGIVLEDTSSSETWLEIHKTPRDTWLREMETVVSELKLLAQQQEEEAAAAAAAAAQEEGNEETTQKSSRRGSSTGYSLSPAATSDTKKSRKTRSRSGSPKPGTPPPLLTLTPGEKPSPKFTPPTVVLKVLPPAPVTGCNVSSVMAACQKVDSGEVIGTGQHHIITAHHLEQRDNMFQHLHQQMLKYLPEDKPDPEIIQASFHFVTSSRLTPAGLEQPSQTGRPSTVVVWWTGESNLKQYSLLKTGKELDHKPDVVWPFTTTITSSSSSSCGTYLAVGLKNGNVVLWDRYLGLEKGVINVSTEFYIQHLQFLDPSISSQDILVDYPPYRTSSSIWLLLQTSDGSQYLYNTGVSYLITLFSVTENEGEKQTVLNPMSGVPELLLVVTQDGSLMLKDITSGEDICQLSLPAPYKLTSPWEPVYSFGGMGQMLYVKGSYSEKGEEGEIIEQTSVFVYQLRSFPSLDGYWKRPRDCDTRPVHATLEQRVNKLTKYRMRNQLGRKERQEKRWGMMKKELETILQCQQSAKTRPKHLITPSTYRSTPHIL